MFEKIIRKVVKIEDLAKIRKSNLNKKIVFCTGCYDILQTGHAVFFNQCKQYGDLLVVGVGSDAVIESLKGPSRPINPQNNRVHLVAAMEDVDYAIINSDKYIKGKIDFKEVIEKLKPDIFILNDDDSGIEFKRSFIESYRIKLQLVSREVPKVLDATSTTRIIDKINYAYKAPLRIDFAGGWTDIPYIMQERTGFVSNLAIKPHVEYKEGVFNFSGYPRGSGLSTSTAAELLKMISAKAYNSDSKTLLDIAEDLFNLENKELNWAIGRQDQYSIVYGGYNCFEFNENSGSKLTYNVKEDVLKEFKNGLLLLHTGVSRSAQNSVEEVYQNFNTKQGIAALDNLAVLGKEFSERLSKRDYKGCAEIMNKNFIAQKQLASSSSNEKLEAIYNYALQNGALGGKICGAGGGGAFVFYCENPTALAMKIKLKFVDCFEIDFEIEWNDIKRLNKV